MQFLNKNEGLGKVEPVELVRKGKTSFICAEVFKMSARTHRINEMVEKNSEGLVISRYMVNGLGWGERGLDNKKAVLMP